MTPPMVGVADDKPSAFARYVAAIDRNKLCQRIFLRTVDMGTCYPFSEAGSIEMSELPVTATGKSRSSMTMTPGMAANEMEKTYLETL